MNIWNQIIFGGCFSGKDTEETLAVISEGMDINMLLCFEFS